MADDKNVRFYAAKAAGAALLVNGIGYLRDDVSCVYVVPSPKCVQADVTLPSLVQDESAQSTGAASVVAAVALLDRLPYASVIGMGAIALNFTNDEGRRPKLWLAASAVAFGACAFLFSEKRLQ